MFTARELAILEVALCEATCNEMACVADPEMETALTVNCKKVLYGEFMQLLDKLQSLQEGKGN